MREVSKGESFPKTKQAIPQKKRKMLQLYLQQKNDLLLSHTQCMPMDACVRPSTSARCQSSANQDRVPRQGSRVWFSVAEVPCPVSPALKESHFSLRNCESYLFLGPNWQPQACTHEEYEQLLDYEQFLSSECRCLELHVDSFTVARHLAVEKLFFGWTCIHVQCLRGVSVQIYLKINTQFHFTKMLFAHQECPFLSYPTVFHPTNCMQ